MKFVIERDSFIKGLAKLQGIVEKRNTMPILSNALLKAEEGALVLTATDLEVAITDKCPASVESEGKITLNAKKLHEIVRELPEGPVSFEADADFHVLVKSGKARFDMMGISPDDYPKVQDPSSFSYMKVKAEVLADMIEKTIYATAGDEVRYSLNGIYTLKTEDGSALRMVATDGHRLALVDRKLDAVASLKLDRGVILPRKGMVEASKLIATVEGEIGFALQEKMASIRSDDTVIIMRLLDGKFPDYQRVIIEGCDKIATIDSGELVKNLRRVSIMIDEKARAVNFGFAPGVLRLEGKNPNFGSSYSEFEIGYEGETINIGFNDRYFVDIVNASKSEKIEIKLKDGQSPALVAVPDDPDYTCVVMPMRL